MSTILKYTVNTQLRKWLLDNTFSTKSLQWPTNYCRLKHLQGGGKCLWQNYSTAVGNLDNKSSNAKKSKNVIRITLIQQGAMSVTTLEEAHKLAKRRNMHLLQTNSLDTKTQRPVYKLVSPSDVLHQEFNQMTANRKKSNSNGNCSPESNDKLEEQLLIKPQKLMNIGSRISQHDLSSRLKNITKWLNKHHEIRILIQGNHSDGTNCEQICEAIDNHIKTTETTGKITQRQRKHFGIVLNIHPVLVKNDSSPLTHAQEAQPQAA